MKVGNIILFRGNSFYSKLIKIYNHIEYDIEGFTHVGIVTEVKDNKITIHEALSQGFVANEYNENELKEKLSKDELYFMESKIKLTNVKNNSNKYLGRGYAWFDIFGIVISMIFGFKFLKVTGANKLICSEAVSRVVYNSSNKKINLEEEFNKSFDLITPTDIFLSKYFK